LSFGFLADLWKEGEKGKVEKVRSSDFKAIRDHLYLDENGHITPPKNSASQPLNIPERQRATCTSESIRP
jgi:hypothetical protein